MYYPINLTLQDLFAHDKQRLDNALSANVLEKNHLRRCMDLAHMVQWRSRGSYPTDQCPRDQCRNRDNEFGRLLGREGVAHFDQILQRIVESARGSSNPQIRSPEQLLIHALFVHDLGKYDETADRYDGTNHEERSAQIVSRQRGNLIQQLGWQNNSVDLLVALARFHAILGIVHLGGASMVYLTPLLAWVLRLDQNEQRLFLDLLIIINCCDSAASGDFDTGQFYLNHDRLLTYARAADEIMHAVATLGHRNQEEPQTALVSQATQLPNMVERVQRIVSSNNVLNVTARVAEQALHQVIAAGHFDPVGFSFTRFDHGTYVFEPLLHRLLSVQSPKEPTTIESIANVQVDQDALAKVLLFIGMLCQQIRAITVISLRDSYSMKPDLQPQNQPRFDALAHAVSSNSIEEIAPHLAAIIRG